jgi:DNA-binding GntR family transcriptional regulator
VRTLRTLAAASALTNTATMLFAAVTTDPRMFVAGLIGAGFSTYGWLYFTEEAEAMGDTRTGYMKLAQRLRWEIKEENMQPGQRLPTTKDLAEKHHTTRRTVMRAMYVLADEGLIEVVHGRGCYIAGVDRGQHSTRAKERIEWHLTNNSHPGDELPTVANLTELCRVSSGTVRKVVAELVREGVIRQHRGRLYRT